MGVAKRAAARNGSRLDISRGMWYRDRMPRSLVRIDVEWPVESYDTVPWTRRCEAVAYLSDGTRLVSTGRTDIRTFDPVQKAIIEVDELCSLRDHLRAAGMPVRGLWQLTALRHTPQSA